MQETPRNVTIRSSTIDDADAIGIMVDEFRAYLHALGDVDACVNFGREQYRRDGFGDDPAFEGLIAEEGKQAVGYALYAFDYSTDTGRRGLFLHDLFVRSTHRGMGIGEALMERLSVICKDAGGEAMSWLVWHTNESAIRFYEKLGARTVDKVRLMRMNM